MLLICTLYIKKYPFSMCINEKIRSFYERIFMNYAYKPNSVVDRYLSGPVVTNWL